MNLYRYTRRFAGAPAEPLLQIHRNFGVAYQATSRRSVEPTCCRCMKLKLARAGRQSFTTKRSYHRQILQHFKDSKDEEAFLKYLKKNIVYQQDGIIGMNKPPGLGVSGRADSSLTIASMMTVIADAMDCYSVEIAQGLEKESSGLVLLGESKVAAKELQKKILDARKRRQFIKTYKAIVCGIPEKKEDISKVYLGIDVINGESLTVSRHNASRNQIRDGDVWSSETKYKVISVNEELGCSLMELQPLRVRRHQLQVQMSLELCPILGDHIYSHQVKTVLGKPVLMDPHQVLAKHNIQVLSPGVRKALSMTNQQVSRLPLFLHLQRIVLPEWAGNHDVAIEAPLPSHFTVALNELGLGSVSYNVKQLPAS